MPRRSDVLWAASATALALAVLQLDASDAARSDRAPDLLGALLAVAACAPVAVRRARPLAAAVVALPFACVALALGYMVVVPVLVALVLCGMAALHSAQRVTVPLAAYAGTSMSVAVAITGDDSPVPVGIVVGAAVGVTAVLIGDAIRSERERGQRIAELRDRDVARAVVEERLRIARDVHDITGHHLSAISLHAAGAGRATSDPAARAALERIHRLTSEALGQTRRALGVLREPRPVDAAARPAVHTPTPRLEQVERLLEPARAAGLAVDLRLDGAGRQLSDEIEVCAYRVVQESLTNVVRHAGASSVRVRIGYGERELRIAVDDDGVGGPGRPGGGIEGMRERVAIVGGSFAAGPAGHGWSVQATLPLETGPDERGAPPTAGVAQVAP